MSSPAYRTWKKRIDAYDNGAEIPKSIIQALTRRMANNFSENPDDLSDLLRHLDIRGFAWRITQAQTEQGLKWLNRPAVSRHLTDQQRHILDTFSHFLFVGTFETSRGYGLVDSAPIYRVRGRGPCEYFDYIPRPWQSVASNGLLPFEIVGGAQ